MRWDGHVEGQDDPNGHAQLARMSDQESRPISWLWEPLIPKRKVTLLVGWQEMGKSFFAGGPAICWLGGKDTGSLVIRPQCFDWGSS